jgi:hypothetical protein
MGTPSIRYIRQGAPSRSRTDSNRRHTLHSNKAGDSTGKRMGTSNDNDRLGSHNSTVDTNQYLGLYH